MRSQLALGALALVVGFAVAAVPRLLEGDDGLRVTKAARGNPRSIPTSPIKAPPAPSQPVAATPAAPEEPALAAVSPSDAVQAFLRAESTGDFATSYGLLAAEDRMAQRSRAGWVADHAQLPVVRSFVLGDARVTATRAEVDARVTLRPELDPVVGLVPATASATWIAVREDGGWRVAFAESTLIPEYAPPDTAPAAASSWVADRRACRAHERAGLLTTGRLTDQLCGGHGPTRVGAPVNLEPGTSSDRFLAAYGPDVFTWARVVPVTSPARVGAVLAPLGPRWRVIGLVDLPAMQSSPREGAEL
ncbi:MAG TPA: hypothetical protein VIH82_01075 [Acidimicrobiia bacterium]|jgi:hypothetical protein